MSLFRIFLIFAAFTVAVKACTPTNNPAVIRLTEPLPSSTMITFDDIGLQGRWNSYGNSGLDLSKPNQTITLFDTEEPTQTYCRVTVTDDWYAVPWNGLEFWAGSTTEKLEVMRTGCKIKFDPPISAFTARFNGSPWYQAPWFEIADAQATALDCQAIPLLPPTNNFIEFGFASATRIGYIYFVNPAWSYFVDNIRILTCDNGLFWNGTDCIDMDECLNNPCSEYSTCENSVGSYECICDAGYEMNNETCVDIDECATMSPCSSFATCTNTNGSFSCECNDGYEGNGQGQNGCQSIETPNNSPSNNPSSSNGSPSAEGPQTTTPASAGRTPVASGIVSSSSSLLSKLTFLIASSLLSMII